MIDSMDKLVAGFNKSQSYNFYKTIATMVTGYMNSTWKVATIPSQNTESLSSDGVIPTNMTTGAIQFHNPDSSNKLYLGRLSVACSAASNIIIFDRIYNSGGLSGSSTGTASINMPSLTRYTDGIGLELFVEILSATGTTVTNMTITYKDESGSDSSTTFPFVTSATGGLKVGQLIPVPLNPNDRGIKSITSIKVDAACNGVFGLTLCKRIADIAGGTYAAMSLTSSFDLGLPEIQPNACLFIALTSTASSCTTMGSMTFIEG